jgi:hypothetical protein
MHIYNTYKSDFPNQVHQLNVSIAKNHYLLKDGTIKHQLNSTVVKNAIVVTKLILEGAEHCELLTKLVSKTTKAINFFHNVYCFELIYFPFSFGFPKVSANVTRLGNGADFQYQAYRNAT